MGQAHSHRGLSRVDFKALFSKLSLFSHKPAANVTYVWVVVRLPLTEDEVRAIASHWIAVDAQAVLANPAALAAMKSDLHFSDEGVNAFVSICEFQVFRHFPLIGMAADPASLDALRALPCVRYAHSVPDDYSTFYLNVIKALHYVIDEGPDKPEMAVVNLSLQPLDPYPYQPLEAMNVATEVVASHGKTMVFAAGNFGDRGNGSMNPWSLAPWVISVGAADEAGTRLWSGSARGVPGDPDNHPTLVAPGIDVLTTRAPNDPVDPTVDNPNYVRVTGTSFAVPCVTGICAQIHEFISVGLLKSSTLDGWRVQVTQQFQLDLWPIAPEPATVKRMLIDMAQPMPEYGLHEVGAGFVNNDIAQAYYRNFRLSNFLNVFGKERKAES
jgi:Subtilase family